MAISNDLTAVTLASDSQGIDALRLKARTDPKGAVKETARQFEALLMNVMLKGMRDTIPQDGIFDSEQTRLYTSMLDQQLSQTMAKRGIGIAEVLARQLSPPGQAVTGNAAAPAVKSGGLETAGLQPRPHSAGSSPNPSVVSLDANGQARNFIERLTPDAEVVSRESGIPVRFLLGHAALESGWGRSEIRMADGTPSHNLFGVKAGAGWQGRSVDVKTTEYEDGIAHKKVETFRAYDSYQDSLRDYAKLLATSPRYAEVLKNTSDARAYARELQDAGYATDPHYAEKLSGVIDGKALRVSRLA